MNKTSPRDKDSAQKTRPSLFLKKKKSKWYNIAILPDF